MGLSPFRTRYSLALVVALTLSCLLAGCGGDKKAAVATQPGVSSSAGVEGGESPEAAVKAFVEGFSANDRTQILNATDPSRRDEALEFVNAPKFAAILNRLSTGSTGAPSLGVGDLKYTAQNADISTAVVVLSGKVRFQNKDEVLDKETLPTIKVDGRWFVTSTKPAPAPTGSTAQPAWMVAMLDDNPALPGQYIPPHPGPDLTVGTQDDRLHVANGSVIQICTADQVASGQIGLPPCYTSNPPTSGMHAQSSMVWAVLTQPAPRENLVHNMEHGGVVVWYNTNNQQVINQLAGLVTQYLNQRVLIVMSAYADMEPDTIALTAWTRLDKFPVSQFSIGRVDAFIQAHARRFNPEGF